MEIYCRKLGHYLTLDYCSREQGQYPCRKILDCWKPYGLREDHLSPYAKRYLSPPGTSKVADILRIVSDSGSPAK